MAHKRPVGGVYRQNMRTKLIIASGVILAVTAVAVISIRVVANRAPHSETAPPTLNSKTSASAAPTDRQISAALNRIEREPATPAGYNLLADAYMQKARETGDFSLNSKADAALARALEVAPDNYDAIKLRAKLLLTYHRFADALAVANHARQIKPRDYMVYGAITDAQVELGNYIAAIAAAQTMVDLHPDLSSYSRVSYLRTLHGDTNGAIAAMRAAVAAAGDREGMAWCRVQLGNELLHAGQLVEGEREFDHALYVMPDYHLALAAKAHARVRAGDYEGAAEFYKRAEDRVPLPDYAGALGDLYTQLGRAEDAKRQYDLVEFVERTGAIEGTYTRQLALFWADHDMRLDDALAAVQRERAIRADIYTSDALAWCLYKKGQIVAAQAAMTEALRLGTRDPRLLYHAGLIANARGDHRAAATYLKNALAIDPAFNVLQADEARLMLRSIKG